MPNKIEDFGNKIGGAKKDLWGSSGLSLKYYDDLNAAERSKYIQKKYVWPKMDYQKMVDEGMSKATVYYIKCIYDATAIAPIESDTDEKKKGYITFVTDLKEKVENIKSIEDINSIYLHLKDTYCIGLGYRLALKKIPENYLTNRLLKASQHSERWLNVEVRRHQFCYTDEDKKKEMFAVHEYGNDLQLDEAETKRYSTYTNKESLVFNYRDETKGMYCYYDRDCLLNRDHLTKNPFVIIQGTTVAGCSDSKENALNLIDTLYSKYKEANKLNQNGKERKTKYKPSTLGDFKRIGPKTHTYNVRSDDMLSSFHFYGGEFGNWLNESERARNLNDSHDAFSDLAMALGIKREDISFNQKLSIAYGARGSGNALAHYEPLRDVINLTKYKGAGSLAHEYGHAIDDQLGDANNLPGLLTEAINSHYAAKSYTYGEEIESILSTMKYNGSERTNYYKESKNLDSKYSKSTNGYWSSNCEMFARAFACYVKDKLTALGVDSPYLTGHAEMGEGTPRGEDRIRINEKFDQLIAKMKENNLYHTETYEKYDPKQELQTKKMNTIAKMKSLSSKASETPKLIQERSGQYRLF